MILRGNPNLVVSATAVLQIWKPLVEAGGSPRAFDGALSGKRWLSKWDTSL